MGAHPGIQIGQPAPDFILKSASGDVKLSDYRHKSHVILYFIRAFGCLACQRRASELAKDYDRIRGMGATILVIGGGSDVQARQMEERFKLPFRVLADPDESLYREYSLHKTALRFQTSGTVLIDKEGDVRHYHRVANPYESLDAAKLSAALVDLNRVG